ncbi:MAG: 3-hydroxyacyl-CoA dehydrogenase NAD-binding domain-containing protein [Bacillota bacterium]|nr:3-hydroxyacyl-CoA dehydrogenase NAD-binding domain-containing protein [Bacillota bacterium]
MEIKTGFVLGAGIMGAGIAHLMAQNGVNAILVDVDEGILKRAVGNIEKLLTKKVEKGKMTDAQVKELLGRIKISTDMNEAANADFIIEAVIENVELKQKIFAQLEGIAKPGVVLATNTTACSISEISSSLKDPSRVVGMHFFNPAVVMKLVEIMPGVATDPAAVKTAKEFAEFLGKEPVVTNKETIAGIASRVLAALLNEAVWVLEEGIGSVADIDKAMMMGSNQPMGPLTLIDLIGIDTHLAKTRTLYAKFGDARYRPCYLLEKMVHAGYLGRKSGKGFYDYSQNPPVPMVLK